MDSQIIAVDTNRLQSDRSSMEDALKEMRKRLKEMFDSIQALNGMWEGQAHQAFSQQFGRDYIQLLEICNVLEQLIKSIENAKKEYRTCEDTIGDLIRSIQI